MTVRVPTLARLAAAAALPALLAFAPLPAAAQSAEAGLRAFAAAINASPDWAATFQSVTGEANGRNGVMTGLTIRPESDSGFSVTFDPIRLTGYAETSGGGFTAEEINVAGATLSTPVMSFRMSSAKFTGVGVPGLGSYRFDKDKPFTSMIRSYGILAKARLAQGTIDRIDFRQTVNGVTSTGSYGAMTIGRIADGRIESMAAGPMVIDAPSPEGLVKVSIERVEALRYDLNALIKVFDPDQYAGGVGDGEWRTAVGFAGYRNFTIDGPGARVSLGSVSMEDMRVRQPPKSFAPFFDAIMVNPNLPPEESKRLAAEHALNLVWSMGIGRLSLEGMDVAGTGFDRFRVGQFYIRNLSADGIGEISLSDSRVAVAGEGSASLGRMLFGDIIFPKLQAINDAIAASERGVDPDPLPLVPKLGFFEMGQLSVSRPNRGTVTLDRTRLDMGGYVGPIPTAIDFDLRGLNVDVATLGEAEARKIFSDLGYQRVTAEHGFSIRWSEASESLSLSNFRIGLKEMGKFTADIQLAGLKRSALERVDQLAMAVTSLLFTGARFVVEDESLFNRVITMQARKSNLDPEVFRQQIAGAVPFFLMMLRNPDFQTKLAPTLQAFIQAPGRLVLSAKPSTPVPVTTILTTAERSPERLPNLLAIEVVQGQ